MVKYMLLMAVTTYLIRMLPLVLFQKEIKNKYVQSFLYYVPYACLTAMTIPAIFYATGSMISAGAGLAVALFLGWRGKSLPIVALAACIVVFIVELMI
ncbi:MAG: AzlD domain-containing protein [Lachnospiraceae bacterium]|nr:AzlD domain-containing protein [Lachnospiraceae bacterium]